MKFILITSILLLVSFRCYADENQLKVNQYLKEKGLETVVLFKNSEKKKSEFTFKINSKLTNLQKKSLIKLHNLGAFNASFIYRDYRLDMHNRFVSYGILQFLTQYAIKHKDVFLLRSLLNENVVSRGDGEYAESFDSIATIPLVLQFPDIDKFLSDAQIQALSSIVFFDWFEVNGDGSPDQYKKNYKTLLKQSQRLGKWLDTNLKGMILVMNDKLEYATFNEYVTGNHKVSDVNMFFCYLLEKYNLIKELEKYYEEPIIKIRSSQTK